MNLNAALLQPKRIVVQVSRGLPGPKGQVDASDVNDAVLAWLAVNDLPGVVRYDITQTLTENERDRARTNVGLSPIDCGVF
jgi:hypothetical protein